MLGLVHVSLSTRMHNQNISSVLKLYYSNTLVDNKILLLFLLHSDIRPTILEMFTPHPMTTHGLRLSILQQTEHIPCLFVWMVGWIKGTLDLSSYMQATHIQNSAAYYVFTICETTTVYASKFVSGFAVQTPLWTQVLHCVEGVGTEIFARTNVKNDKLSLGDQLPSH